ncbi:MAG: hypothetical protein DRQ39_05310 [Gammaproteobacteria bacterium]|nr:MAG: hypothetical protein DRQ39_05310 [Gammaproteobacteria bacterium]
MKIQLWAIQYNECDYITYAVDCSELDMSTSGWLLVQEFNVPTPTPETEAIYGELIASRKRLHEINKQQAEAAVSDGTESGENEQ